MITHAHLLLTVYLLKKHIFFKIRLLLFLLYKTSKPNEIADTTPIPHNTKAPKTFSIDNALHSLVP